MLETLRRLQDLERQAATLRTDLEAVDERRRQIEAPVHEAQAAFDAISATIEDRQAQRRAGDHDVATLQQRLTKFRQQLMAVTNGREYDAVQHEIATVESALKAREDQTLALLFELDELAARAEEWRRTLAARKDAAGVALAGEADVTQRHRLELAAVEGSIGALLRRAPGVGFGYSLEVGAWPARHGPEGYLFVGLGLELDFMSRPRPESR